MARRLPNPHRVREPELLAWADLPGWYWKAFGVALLLGMVTGLGWIA